MDNSNTFQPCYFKSLPMTELTPNLPRLSLTRSHSRHAANNFSTILQVVLPRTRTEAPTDDVATPRPEARHKLDAGVKKEISSRIHRGSRGSQVENTYSEVIVGHGTESLSWFATVSRVRHKVGIVEILSCCFQRHQLRNEKTRDA